MRFAIFILILLSVPCSAEECAIIECKGPLVTDWSEVTATIYRVSDIKGKIVMTTSTEVFESGTGLEFDKGLISVFDNEFQMFFTVSKGIITENVQAYRDGMFFVDEFTCKQLPH